MVHRMINNQETQVQKCRSCGAEIVFLRTKKHKLIPVDAATVRRDDYQFDYARHKAHFATCPDADKFRRR
jgi:pentose-5-phosphate-3-epimerase